MAKKTAVVEEKARESAPGRKRPQPQPPPSGSAFWLCVAAWLIPGLGHFLLGRKWRALILFACIIGMFILGLLMQGQFFATGSGSYLESLGYFAELCVGLARGAASFFGYTGGQPLFVCSDYGTAYLISAGMLNVLSILDVYDYAVGRKA